MQLPTLYNQSDLSDLLIHRQLQVNSKADLQDKQAKCYGLPMNAYLNIFHSVSPSLAQECNSIRAFVVFGD